MRNETDENQVSEEVSQGQESQEVASPSEQ